MSKRPMGVPESARSAVRIAGIQLYYERRSSDDVWGDLDPSEEVGFYLESPFRRRLNDCFEEINQVFSHRAMRGIISAGAWVDKPGMHKLARAFDLDGIVWKDSQWRATEYFAIKQARLYLVIQAICMKHFGTVLGHLYNKAHGDHIHLDDEKEPGFRHNSRSVVSFIQVACNTFFSKVGVGILIADGSWGPKTAEAMKEALGLPFEQYPNDEQHFAFLNLVIATVKKEEGSDEKANKGIEQQVDIINDIRGKLNNLETRLRKNA